jgi:hypothetical protein
MHAHFIRSHRAIVTGGAVVIGLLGVGAWPGWSQDPRVAPGSSRIEVPLDPNQNIRDMNDTIFRVPAQMRPSRPGGTINKEQAAELSGAIVPRLPPSDVAGLKKVLPPGAAIQLRRRRTQVQELESAWTDMRRQLEQRLADVLNHAKLETSQAESEFQARKQQLDVAEFALMEYAEGTYPHDRALIQDEIKLTESELARAQERVDMTAKAFEDGNISRDQKVYEELKLQRAKFQVEQAQSKLNVLENYTKAKTIKELRTDVEKARLEVHSKQIAVELARAREKRLTERSEQIHSRLTEAHVAALLAEAASLQARVVKLLTGIQGTETTDALATEEARLRADEAQKTITQARGIEDTARSRLAEALELAKLVQSWRDELRDPEERLRTAREALERLERVILKQGDPPAPSRIPATAAAKNKLPPGGQILLQRRRAEVRELEAAWASRLHELEQHLSDILADAKAATSRAEAEYQDSKLKREIAEIAFKEYAEGIYLQDKATLLGEIKLAESDLARRADRLDLTERVFSKGNISRGQVESERLAFQRARFGLSRIQNELDVLENGTKPKTLQDLRARIEEAQIEELSRQRALERAKAREKTMTERSESLNSRFTEAHIASLLAKAESLQGKVVELLGSAQPSGKTDALPAGKAGPRAEVVQRTLAQARVRESDVRSKLAEALELARLVQAWREELRDAEARLRKAHEGVERLERLMHEH